MHRFASLPVHNSFNKRCLSCITQEQFGVRPMNLTQCKRLEQAGIEYGFFYLTSISGKGNGEAGAKASARVFNQLHPFLIGPNMLTIYPESDLYQEIQNGT